jgi:hypothetical protein
LKLQRAISKYLTDNVTGLHAFKDEIAFVAAGNPYPYFLIDLISTRKRDLGTGLWDRTENSTQIKVTKHHQVLRFTIRAVNGQEQNGNVIVTEVSDQIDNLLSDLCREGSVDLIDPETEESLHIERTVFQSRSDLAPLEKRIPFVYQQSLSYLFVEHRFKVRVVENRIDQLNIEI